MNQTEDPDLPEYRISDDEFNRLPPEVQASTRQAWAEHAERKRAQRKRMMIRRRNAALLAAFGSGLLGVIIPGSWSFPLILAATSATAASQIVKHALNTITGMIVYGVQAITVSQLCVNIFAGSDSGGYGGGFAGGIMFSTWILHLIIGFAIGKMAENRE